MRYLMLAQSAAEQEHWLWIGLAVLGVLVGIGVGLKTLFGRNPPLDRELADFASKNEVAKITIMLPTFATKEEMRTMEGHLSGQMHEQFNALDKKRSISIGTLHTNLKEVENAVSALDERTKTTNHKLDSIEQKLDRMIERRIHP